jgi:6,7-dimethyl-8-ribityllumazine synthase
MIAAVLLVAAGLAKALHPDDTATALRGAGLPIARLAVRLGGAIEVVIGAAAVIRGDRATAVLVAVSYLSFAGLVAAALARDLPIATCGCFGRDDTPPSWAHVGVNLGAAGAAIAVALDPAVGIADVLESQPLAGGPFVLLVLVGAGAAALLLTQLPRVSALVRQTRGA